MRRFRLPTAALAALAATALTPLAALPASAQSARAGTPIYKDASQPIEARVEDLLARMTIEEKAQQMVAIWLGKDKIQTPAGEFDGAKASQNFPNGIGQISRPYDRRSVTEGPAAGAAASGVSAVAASAASAAVGRRK